MLVFICFGGLIVVDVLFVLGAVEVGGEGMDAIEGFEVEELGHG